jgi:hypothetical protein
VQALGFLKLELAVIHDSAYWRHRRGRNFNQIKIRVLGHLHRFAQCFNARLLTIFVYQSNLVTGDFTIDSGFFIGYVNNSNLIR